MKTLKPAYRLFMAATVAASMLTPVAAAEKLVIATVNNGDMVRMQGLTDDFLRANPDIELEWVTLEETILRQKVTQDIAAKGGQFDVLTIGTYEVPLWAKKDWLVPLDGMPESWDAGDFLAPISNGLSHEGKLYAAPFYGESSMMMYRRDLFQQNGLKMPDEPSWGQVYEFARALHNPPNVYGICLRGKASWGENIAFITTVANSFGARWFDENWRPQFDSAAWRHAVSFYVDLLQNYGPPGASTNGFNENLALMNTGKCGMWIDATVAAGFVTGKDSQVADKMDFAQAPHAVTRRGSNWLWAWSLAIPAGTQKADAAKKFIAWATSKEYSELVASREGWRAAPPGTRKSLYENPEYTKAAFFADRVLRAIESADPITGTLRPKPYVGVQFVAIDPFQGIGTAVGQELSAALAGTKSVEEALEAAQSLTEREMKKAGLLR
ncbi:MAG: ABC transporter substrate-binding protein [Gammaproteobacteria bacterium]